MSTHQPGGDRKRAHPASDVQRLRRWAVSVAMFASCSTALAPGIASADSCLPTAVIGAAGTGQGPAWSPPNGVGKDELDAQVGPQVHAAITAIADRLGPLEVGAINYPATGLEPFDTGAVTARVAYDISAYRMSKDLGYSRAYEKLKKEAAECRSKKFVLVGYSQGGHIMGDLAQSVFHGNGPVDRSRIAAVVLIAEPAYNGPSPRTTEAIYSQGKLTQDQDHWSIGGSLGQRAAFETNDPVVSICVYGDPVCDGKDLFGQDGKPKAVTNKDMHFLYLGHPFEGVKDFATWAGVQAARIIQPTDPPGPAPAELPGKPSTPPAPAPPAREAVTIAQADAKTVTVTVADAAGAGPRAVRCWNATDATHNWKTNYLGEIQISIPRNGTFTVTCPTAPKPGTFSLEFFNWRWSPAIQWR
ncbi:cutinase family protein [Nocardia sp. NPDC056564]|uniref:cutinase family protein n=1 Tax=Nocardia sp. NPDC056564 TaxID=3345865 RepID=UPI00366E0CE5